MAFLRSLAARLAAPHARREGRAGPPETRADPSWAALAGGAADYSLALDAAGPGGRPAITPRLAENLSIYLAAINAISSALASLPIFLYRRAGDARELDEDHPFARLVAEGPNARQSMPDFIEWLTAQTLNHGNGLAEIVAGRDGQIVELVPHNWPNVTPLILPSGRLAYDVAPADSLHGATGKTRRLLDTEVIHIRDRSDDGLIGRSRLARSAGAVRAGLAQEAYVERLYHGGAHPSGVLKHPGLLSDEARSNLKSSWNERYAGLAGVGRTPILEEGLEFEPVSITPEQLEMLAARRLTTEDVARMFGVPPPIVGDYTHNTFTNSQAAGRWFAIFTLAPWIRKLEEALRRGVFSPEERASHEIEFDMTGFLRGDAEARWQAHAIAVQNGILTPNEIREIEGWNPRAELDAPPAHPAGGIG